jgi:CRISPR/Cas system-associated exonuclease Cas4 (RecB family)
MVIDYKTGSITEANGKKLDNITDFQMSIYNNILKQKRDIENIELVFIKVLDDGEYEYLNNIDDKDEILLSQIRELKEMDTFMALKCDNLSNCKYCDYKLNCGRDIYS